MRALYCSSLTLGMLVLFILPSAAQDPPPAPAVAATVNGQDIPESAVQRGLSRLPPARQAEVRSQQLDFLIDNTLIDQYLHQLKVQADPKEVTARIEQIQAEIKKQGQTVDQVLKKLQLSEAELRTQVDADLRWEKFTSTQGTEAELRKFFENNREAFDGSQVRARHILVTAASGDASATEQVQAQLLALKKQVEEAASTAVAKVQAGADPLAKEKARTEAIDQTFATLAREKSACPSKKEGGDTDWFQRSGGMVEPFARAAFALKLYQVSEPVKTQFGYHLILVTERRAGKEVKFEDVKAEVKEIYGERLREAVCAYMRARAKIVITPTVT
jgi:parvulin-like peptidyl-prolyl isomerase